WSDDQLNGGFMFSGFAPSFRSFNLQIDVNHLKTYQYTLLLLIGLIMLANQQKKSVLVGL
ncbi:hypothetical protein, partial [Francisella tularensis]|uniref:hypothetical protein n=1 Tax=Francisella tularensis TaxID=263 RepID=UPI000CAF7DFC